MARFGLSEEQAHQMLLQIENLGAEARMKGDWEKVALCELAMHGAMAAETLANLEPSDLRWVQRQVRNYGALECCVAWVRAAA